MSVNPLSVNSLGESVSIDLINSKMIYIENQEFKSKFGSIVFDGSSLKSKNQTVQEELKKSFSRIKKSALWGSHFLNFSYNDKKGISCDLKNSCVGRFITLSGLLRSKKFAPYRVLSFIKGKELLLIKKKKKTPMPRKIRIKRVKDVSDGILFLKQNKIDLFYPHENINEYEKINEKNNSLSYKEKEGRHLRLSLYYKYGQKISKPFFKAFCQSINSIRTSFSDWSVIYNSCEDKRGITLKDSNKIKAIGNSKLTNKFFDIIYQNKNKKFILQYHILKPYNLTKTLKTGEFDFYMSEEIFDKSFPILYDAFHSKGSFNTLKYKSNKLDKALESSLNVKSLKEFYLFQNQTLKVLKKEEALLIRFKKKNYYLIYRNNYKNLEKLRAVIQYL